MTRRSAAIVVVALFAPACASAPPRTPAATGPSLDQRLEWILRLEDQRVLRAEAPAPAPAPVTTKGRRGAPPAAPVAAPDLVKLVADADARIRRRAAIAIGRVGLAEGTAPLLTAVTDTDPDVRQMAAFALGLLADKAAVPALTAALQDADARVRGRAAEGLGLIGEAAAPSAAAIGTMIAGYVKQGAIASIAPDDEQWPKSPESDAVRLGLFALVRLKAWDPLAAAVLDSSGRPVSSWWPVAFALRRIGDKRALPALQQLAQTEGRYTRAFAARGLGALKDPSAVPTLLALLERAGKDQAIAASVVMALKDIGSPDAAPALSALLGAEGTSPNLRLETVSALGALHARSALPLVQDFLTDDWPIMRAAAIRAVAQIDPDAFMLVLSGMEPDPHWIVRAALADVLGTMQGPIAIERVKALLDDSDKRVVPSAIEAMTKLKAPGVEQMLLEQLKTPDFGVRAAAARALGELKSPTGPAALRDAYRAGLADATYTARAAALAALAAYGAAEATDTLKAALTDKDWALRLRAAELLAKFDPSADTAHAIRPAPTSANTSYAAPDLITPEYSPHVFIETTRGTIEIELTVLDAPQTAQNFMALARKGFFNGLQVHRVVPNFVVQDGDPRGDGEGGPGYTIRDELNDRPYLRGVVGMALEWRDTGGSQFFITHSPQPHLDGKYTVFGRVVQGMDVVDRIQQLDVIERVRTWDGKTMQ